MWNAFCSLVGLVVLAVVLVAIANALAIPPVAAGIALGFLVLWVAVYFIGTRHTRNG